GDSPASPAGRRYVQAQAKGVGARALEFSTVRRTPSLIVALGGQGREACAEVIWGADATAGDRHDDRPDDAEHAGRAPLCALIWTTCQPNSSVSWNASARPC